MFSIRHLLIILKVLALRQLCQEILASVGRVPKGAVCGDRSVPLIQNFSEGFD